MYTTNTGYTVEIEDVERAANMFNFCVELQMSHPGNFYWQRRLLAAYDELVRLDLVKERTAYQNMIDVQKDFAASCNAPREVYNANRRAMYRWWLVVQAENGRSTSPYHF
jgi:hypothetical protein